MFTFWDALPSSGDLDCSLNKEWLYKTYKAYFYDRLATMFKYFNLPKTIPSEMLEYFLLSGGWLFFTKVNGELYVFQGGLGGEPDEYYRPTIVTVSNPALNFSAELKIDIDGILVRNDKFRVGLDFLISRYASLMAENIITMRTADIILRCIALLSAPDDSTKASAEEYLKKLANGEIGVISESAFFDGIKMQNPPSSNGSYLTQFIELHQYYKGSFYNEIGLNANFNMKRESIGKGEASLSEDSLMPLCDSMLSCRIEDFDKVNEMFGTDIKVSFDSAWRQNQIENYYELQQIKNESSQLEKGDDDNKDESGIGTGDSEFSTESEIIDRNGDEFGDSEGNEQNQEEDSADSEENNSEQSEEFSDENESTDEKNASEIEVTIKITNEGEGEDVKDDKEEGENVEDDDDDEKDKS